MVGLATTEEPSSRLAGLCNHLEAVLETFMGLDQRTGAGTNPRIPRVVSKSDRDHGMATTDTSSFS